MSPDQVQRIGERIYIGIPRPYDGAMAVVVGDDRTLVVDGSSYAPFAVELVEHVEAAHGSRPRLLVLTHQHFDHFAGLAAFDEPIMATSMTKEILETYDQAWLDENLASWKANDMVITDLLGEPAVRIPTRVCDETVQLDLGGVIAEFIPVGGHVPDLAVVNVVSEGTLIASDMIGNGRDLIFPDSHLDDWERALERFLAEPPVHVVPGHGPIGGPELLTAQLDAVRVRMTERS